MSVPNRLAAESSPYLRQHAGNPVDWYPWGNAALAAARASDRPLLLSVGYAACHWCHVMAHESFEDPEVAALMNDHFICVKVDREEHPDVDAVYQAACQGANGQGGWPLTAFLTPDLEPFYVGTYFPPRARYGRPGFVEVLDGLARAWSQDRATVRRVAADWSGVLRGVFAAGLGDVPGAPGVAAGAEGHPSWPDVLASAAATVLADLDPLHGGFAGAPKFPNAPALEFLLRSGGRAAERAVFTLRCMAGGGIYDHLGGGFHRYSVDAAWQVPHFEKMLYDNACLVPLYLSAFQRTGEDDLARVARETLEYLLRDMRSPEGAFCSSEDADSLGPSGRLEEGAFYTWTPEEVRDALGDQELAELACRHFGVAERGNAEGGRSVLHLQALSVEGDAAASVAAALRRARSGRARPARDHKVLAAWNGLAISAFARAGRILAEPRYRAAAETAARLVLCRLRAPDGGLLRCWLDGRARIAGTLEDYAFMMVGLIDLYEATFDAAWLGQASDLARQTIRRFWAPEAAAFYLTDDDRPDLITRPRDDGDAGTPSAQSTCLQALLRLRPYVEDPAFAAIPEQVFTRVAGVLRRHPRGVASLLCALSLAAGDLLEVTIAAPGDDPTAKGWLEHLRGRYLPNLVLSRTEAAGLPGGSLPPVWRERGMVNGRPTLWVCRGSTCLPPAHRWEDVDAALAPAP